MAMDLAGLCTINSNHMLSVAVLISALSQSHPCNTLLPEGYLIYPIIPDKVLPVFPITVPDLQKGPILSRVSVNR